VRDLVVPSDSDVPKADDLEEWPPVGFSAFYTVTEKLDGQPERGYHVLLPGTFSKVDLSTIRVGRHGGPNEADMRYRDELYRRVGEIAVAGGHAEAAMKRLLLVLERPDEAHFAELVELGRRLPTDSEARATVPTRGVWSLQLCWTGATRTR
jgi:hypothetical protein